MEKFLLTAVIIGQLHPIAVPITLPDQIADFN